MDKRCVNTRKPVAKRWEKLWVCESIWKGKDVFNVSQHAKNDGLRADLKVIPKSTVFITITTKTYILKNLKIEIQGIVVCTHFKPRLYGGFEE